MAKTGKPYFAQTPARSKPMPPRKERPTKAALQRRRRRITWLSSLGAAVVIALVVVIAVHSGGSTGAQGVTRADAFDLPRLGAPGRVTLAAHRGRPTVVNMFASWCSQCDAELPGFHAAATALKDKVDFVFVNSNETGSWRSMAERHQLLDFEVGRDIGGTQGNGLYRSFGGAGGMPMTAFFDGDGRLVQTFPGALVGSSLPKALQKFYGVTY